MRTTVDSTHRRLRRLAIFALSLLLGVSIGTAAPVEFDIQAQSAASALQALGRQAAVKIAYPADELRELSVKAVKGRKEPRAALEEMFNGTPYGVTQTAESNFVVAKLSTKYEAGSVEGQIREEKSGRPVENAVVVIAGTQRETVTDRRGWFSLAGVASGTHTLHVSADGMQRTRVTDVQVLANRQLTLSPIFIPAQVPGVVKMEDYIVSAKKNDGVLELDPYSVEGRREKPFVAGNMDIPRTINDVQAYYIFDAKTIETSGSVNVEDFLKQRLTMNTVAHTNGEFSGIQASIGANGNTSSVNLRGVGRDKTLILVNGRRMPGVSVTTSESQSDLNGIPLSAIDRIEVLPSSASGIYGGSAMGGVVNVILKRDYAGGEVRLTYDNSWDGDSPRRNVSASYGLSLEGGRTHLSVNAAWSDKKPLLLQDRAQIYRDNLVSLQSRSPTFIYSGNNPWLGSLPNIATTPATVTVLTLKPAFGGTVLNSRNTYVPAGTSPTTPQSTLVAGLVANTGQWNLEFPMNSQGPTGLLRPFGASPEMRSLGANLRRQMLPKLELIADFSWNENTTDSLYHPTAGAFTVPATAPTNPFTSNVIVRVPDATDLPLVTRSQTRVAMLGAVAQLPWGWTGALDYTWSENRYDIDYAFTDNTALNAALASGALNPFVDTMRYSMDLQKYFYERAYQGSNRLHDFALRGSGPLPALPWGQPNLTVGLEHRISQAPASVADQNLPLTPAETVLINYFERESTTDSAYLEAAIPLSKSDWLPALHSLEAQLSGRGERYQVDTGTSSSQTFYKRTPPTTSYVGTTLNGQPYYSEASYSSRNYTIGLKYQPVKDVTLRASKATAFLPPTPTQLLKNPLPSTSTTPVDDPKTGQLRVPVYTIGGGNPDLEPQNAKSFNAGVIWEPRWRPLAGLRLNAEYYQIEQFSAIGTLSAQDILNQEAVYPSRITRDSTGKVTHVETSMLNLYKRETEGWDLSANYNVRTPLGRFSLYAVESIILHLKTQYSQARPAFEAASYSPGEEGSVKYKTNATLSWEYRQWNAGWTTRHFSSYQQYGAAGGPYSMQFANGGLYNYYTIAQGAESVPSQTYHDLYIGHSFDGEKRGSLARSNLKTRLLSSLSVQVGVRNVFDKVPPMDVYYGSTYYLSPYGDVRLRSYWMSVRKSF